MSIVVGGILYNNDLLESVEVESSALGAGLGLAALLVIFILISFVFFCKKYKWVAGMVWT
jgi:hypothetical protein